MVASLNQVIIWGKKSPPPRSQEFHCTPNYTENENVRELLDTPVLSHKVPIVQIQKLRLKNSVNKYREIRLVWCNGKRTRHQDIPFWEHYE